MDKLERDIEDRLRRRVEAYEGKCLKWTCPGWRGVPDRIVLLPGGRVKFVETKRPKGGRLSPLQERWHKWLRELGFDVYVVYNDAQLLKFERVIFEEVRDGQIHT